MTQLTSRRKPEGSLLHSPLALLYFVVLALAGSGIVGAARADSEIVVAMRYMQLAGTSHSHLYLYRRDGKLLRQLTRDSSGQDKHPVFAADGETIVFTREAAGRSQIWSIEPRGGGLKLLPQAPEWYRNATDSPYFVDTERTDKATGAVIGAPDVKSPPVFRTPDGMQEIVLRQIANDPNNDIDGEGGGSHYLLRDVASGKSTEMGKLPGFFGLWGMLYLKQDPKQNFLIEKGLRLAFFGLHLNSTDGDTVFALDLDHPRLVRLSPNWSAPVPLPGEPAFLTIVFDRYVPISGSEKTVNSSYIEIWSSALKKMRYASKGAALCYGASLYRPGLSPAAVTIVSSGGD